MHVLSRSNDALWGNDLIGYSFISGQRRQIPAQHLVHYIIISTTHQCTHAESLQSKAI